MSADVTVRCHRCAWLFEVVAYPDEIVGGVYVIPAGMSPSCPHCGYRHPSGLEMTLEVAA